MREEIPLRVRALIGAAGAVTLAGTSVLAIQYGNGRFEPGYHIDAVFSSSSQGLYDGSDVKVRGVNVGTVDGIELDERGRAVVHLFLDPGVEIAEGSTAAIEPLSVFGPKFVRITPPDGEASALAAGETIEQTTDPVEFTVVLSDATKVLEAIEPRDLLTITEALGRALEGMGPTLAKTVDESEVALGSVQQALPSTASLLRDLAALSRTLDEHGQSLVTTASSLHSVLPDLNARGDELGHLLDSTSTLAHDVASILRANGDPLDRTLRHLEPIADLLASRPQDLIGVVRMLDAQFGLLGDIIRIEADDGSLTAATRGNTRGELCDVFPALPCGVPPSQPPSEDPGSPLPSIPLPTIPVPTSLPGIPVPTTLPDIPVPGQLDPGLVRLLDPRSP